MEKYIFEGVTYNVAPNRLEEFLQKYPNATKVEEAGKITGPADVTPTGEPIAMESELDDGSLGQPKAEDVAKKIPKLDWEVDYEYDRSKGIRPKKGSHGRVLDNIMYGVVGKTFDSFKSGTPGELSDEAMNVILMDEEKRGKMTEQDAKPMIDAMKLAESTPPSKAMLEWTKTVDEADNVAYGFIQAMGKHGAEVSYEAMISSMAGQAKAFYESPEIRAAAITTGVAQSKFGGPNPYLRAAGFMRGMMSVLGGAVETSSTFSELIKEQFGGRIPSEKEFVEFAKNEELFNEFRNKALKKGLTVAAVDNFGGGMVVKSVAKTAKKGKKVRAVTKGIVGEAGVGATGEIVSSLVSGQEIQASAVGLEMIGQGPQAVVDIGGAIITPGSYKVNGEKVTLKEVNKILETAKPDELAKINIEIKNDNVLEAELRNKQGDAVLETQIDAKVEDQVDRKNLVNLEKQRVKAEADVKKKGIQAVPGAKENLENIEMQINEIVGKYTAIDGRTKVVKDVKKKAQDVRTKLDEISTEATRVAAAKTTATIKKQMEAVDKKTGRKGQVIEMSSVDIAESEAETVSLFKSEVEGYKQKLNDIKDKKSTEYTETQNDLNFVQEQLDGIKTADKEFGYIIDRTDGSYDIILNKDKPMVGTAAHEFQHRILSRTLKNNQDIQDKAGKALTDYVVGEFGGVSPAFINRMSAYINPETGEQVSEFGEEIITVMSESILDGSLKYNENLFTKVGDVIRQTLQRVGAVDIKFDTGKDIYNFIKDYNRSIEKDYVSRSIVKMAAEGAKGKLVETADTKAKETTRKMSKEASDNVQRIYDDQGVGGAFDIIDAFKPITSKIVERRSEAPNFDRQLLTDEIETGQRGIFDLIRDYKPESGVPLAAYINKFLPARAIEASRRVLGEEFTEDITERVDIAAEEVEVEVKAKPRKKKVVLAERLGVTDKVSKAIQKIIPTLELDNLNFKTLKNKIPEITGELFGISPKKIISGANITKKELQSAQMFISKNADVLLAMLPEGSTPSGTATGVPKTLLKAFYTKGDRAKMAKTGTKAGLAVQVKNSNISKTDFLEVFGIIDGKPVRTDRNTSARVLALANQTGKMITNQAVRQRLGEADAKSKETISRLKDGKSNVMFSKKAKKVEAAKDIFEKADNNKMPEWSKRMSTIQINKISPKTGKMKQYTVRDLFGKYNDLETGAQARDRVANSFIKQFPQHFDMLRTTMSGGVTLSMFQTTAEFELAVPNPVSKQNTVGRFAYHKDKKLNPNAIAKIKNEDFVKNEKAKLPLLKNFLIDMETYLKDNPNDFWFFEEMTRDTQNNMNSIVRVVAPFVAYPIGKNGKPVYNKIAIEEHSFPQIVIGRSSILAASAGKVETVWPVIQASYMQMSLLEADDNKVTAAGLKTRLPKVFNKKILPRILNGELKNLPDGYVAFVRYAAAGVDLNNYKLLNGQTVAEFFGVDGIMDSETGLPDIKKQNDILIKQLTGEVAPTYGVNIAKVKFSKNVNGHNSLNKAVNKSRTMSSKPSKGITVLDFDDTLATTKSLVKYTAPDGKTGTLNAEEYASTYEDLLGQGYTFDFSEFNKVVKGKIAPLFQKALKLQGKFGPENMFVLTARPPQAAKAIFDFLKANGLNIPIRNITGLANSTAEAKALWIADKVGEGYNDFYFADDALQNVQAVKNMLEQFDVKSKVQQARVKFSKGMNTEFNNILENVTGIESKKRFSAVKARKRGESKGKFRFFIPPSHEDFVGLLYNFIGKGKEGNTHRDFFEKALIKPLNRAYRELNAAKQSIANDYKSLNKQFENVKKKLTKKIPDGDFTYQDAVRVYLWDKHGNKIPGLSPTDQQKLVDLVMQDSELQTYAETLNVISKQEKYVAPNESWEAGDIRTDLDDATGRIGRGEFFTEFNENVDAIFSQENLNKIEAAYGADVVSALKDILYRTKTGRNRPSGQNKQTNQWLNYLNGSVAATMFFNIRSAVLQQMSLVNFINYADNNILAAAKAFANQKQYWADWAYIFNSDFMKQRRAGIKTDVNGAELAASVKNATNPAQAAIKKLLELGFLPTQIGDNMAIATGGSTFYRNRINTYLKQGLSKKEAESKAWTDFQILAESTQQSARPDMVSQQQASPLGKVILAFQNVTSQFNRLGKKAFLDIKNRRITPGNTTQIQSDMSNLSRIAYYFAIQNVIFYSLQSALFMAMFDDDEDDKRMLAKKERVINGTLDSVLRGSGVWGAAVSTLKNMAFAYHKEREKDWNGDEASVLVEALNVSPPLGIKARKIVNAERTLNYNKKTIDEMETFDIDNPQWSANTSYIEALTNVPLNRLYNKTQNIRESLSNQRDALERVLLFSGWSKWNLGIEDVKKSKKKQKYGTKKKKSKRPRIINL